ncbi:MAG: tRNA epoxyqueuosine(34) reductase QueG [Myxococcota bacterium]|nr:tRNA epoxyqueuosine(34) reductase QueG [Myxococcota bacterium]
MNNQREGQTRSKRVLTSDTLPAEWAFLSPLAWQLGFVAIGAVSTGTVPQRSAAHYEAYIASGYHADMAYLARHREQRCDLHHPGILRGATALIVAALPYANGATSAGFWKYVSSSARGIDYHTTVRERLTVIAHSIKDRFPKAKCRVFVDTAPVMERTWALLSGIGHIGKSGMLIVPEIGPRVVIGEIICAGTPTIPVQQVAQPYEVCGNCTDCMDACPTRAILSPGTVDSARCLSYWTIESRAPHIPTHIAEHMTGMFGCDQCATVCPWDNPTTASALDPPPDPAAGKVASIEDIATMDDHILEQHILGTALYRTGMPTIRRNAKAMYKNLKGFLTE